MASFSKWLQEIYSMSFLSSNSFFFPEEKYYTQSSKPRHQIEGEQKALIGPWDIAPFVCIVLYSSFSPSFLEEPRWDLEGVFFVPA